MVLLHLPGRKLCISIIFLKFLFQKSFKHLSKSFLSFAFINWRITKPSSNILIENVDSFSEYDHKKLSAEIIKMYLAFNVFDHPWSFNFISKLNQICWKDCYFFKKYLWRRKTRGLTFQRHCWSFLHDKFSRPRMSGQWWSNWKRKSLMDKNKNQCTKNAMSSW